jgi:hypothetical protein
VADADRPPPLASSDTRPTEVPPTKLDAKKRVSADDITHDNADDMARLLGQEIGADSRAMGKAGR